MITLSIILGVLFIACLITSIILFNKNTKISDKNKILKDTLKEQHKGLFNRKGFYEASYNIDHDKKTYVYKYMVHVEELEKYINGYSKLKFIKVDMVHGFNLNTYAHVIKSATQDFTEICETNEITWLESENDIIEMRKLKLERVLK